MDTAQTVTDLQTLVALSLTEDIGEGDVSSELLLSQPSRAKVITREAGIYCGDLWIEALTRELADKVVFHQLKSDGDVLQIGDVLFTLEGHTNLLLSIERTLLNGLQVLCGTASSVRQYVEAIEDLDCTILDTRKTIPGWRLAQKYAVRIGGAKNHRMGLYDAYLLKENHQLSDKTVSELIAHAKQQRPDLPIFVEVESITELQQVIPQAPQKILLDNFTLEELTQAVHLSGQSENPCRLEASGNINLQNVRAVAQTGVHDISIGALTKHVQAIDLSMFIQPS